MLRRRRFKQTVSLKDRLLLFAQETRRKAENLPPGPARDQRLKKANQAETASEQDGWVAQEKASLGSGDACALDSTRQA
jgi:hypothetical protein